MMGWLHHCQELVSKRWSLLSSIYRYTLFREENYINGALEHLGEREFEGREHTDTTKTVMQYDTSHCDTIQLKRFAFAVAFIPGKDAVLNAVAHQ